MDQAKARELLTQKLREGPKSTIAGIGSRELPSDKSALLFKASCLSVITEFSSFSSGGAPGSDATIEHGVKAALGILFDGPEYNQMVSKFLQVYLPGRFFNGRSSSDPGMIDSTKLLMHQKAIQLAHETHPALIKGINMKPFVINLHARNGHQVLGESLDQKVRSVICYTRDGAKNDQITQKTGGTGQALRLAHRFNIPALNIGNPDDEAKLERWVEKRGQWLQQTYGFDIHEIHHNYTSQFSAGLNHIIGDLVKDASNLKLDLLIHGCNCFNTMGSGIAKSIRNAFPEAYHADQMTVKGDKRKLGSYTEADTLCEDHPIKIINAYTQYQYGRENKLYFDYDAFKKILKTLNDTYPGSLVGFPRIGAERAGGCWLTIAEMIKINAPRLKPVIVFHPNDLEYKPGHHKQRAIEHEQRGFNF